MMQDNAVIWVGGRAAGKNMNLKGGGDYRKAQCIHLQYI